MLASWCAALGDVPDEVASLVDLVKGGERQWVGIANDVLQLYVPDPPARTYSMVRHHALMLVAATLYRDYLGAASPGLAALLATAPSGDPPADWVQGLRYGEHPYPDFNRDRIDKIDSWGVMNAHVLLTTDDGWYAKVFATNLLDDRDITNSYLTDASSGLFTNVFVTDPRIIGIALGADF